MTNPAPGTTPGATNPVEDHNMREPMPVTVTPTMESPVPATWQSRLHSATEQLAEAEAEVKRRREHLQAELRAAVQDDVPVSDLHRFTGLSRTTLYRYGVNQ